ncbi:hypothetical protein AAEX28_09185 [Lentisphaerota bacterium WC36G]|nr:alkaline shock response membrane anchor protein AmaP [Lentisphaerae bacterium WC36]
MEICNKIYDLIKSATVDDLPYFYLGCMTAVLLWILLIIIRYFLMFLFREHRCKNLTIKSSGGDVNISAKAIFEVINSLRCEFKFIDIEKISLYETGGKYNFNINLTVNLANQKLPSFVESYKTRILEILENKFGIRNVKHIRLNVKNIQLNYAGMANASENNKPEISPNQIATKEIQEKAAKTFGKFTVKDEKVIDSEKVKVPKDVKKEKVILEMPNSKSKNKDKK